MQKDLEPMRLNLCKLPFPVVTKRLLLRPPMLGDAAELKAAIDESFDELHTWMDWATHRMSLDECEQVVTTAHAESLNGKELLIFLFGRDSNKLIGGTALGHFNEESGTVEIGYWIRKQFSGQGYITEATSALTKYAFDVLRAVRVEIRCDPENSPSTAVARRLGFSLEQHLRGNTTKPHSTIARDTQIFVRHNSIGLPDIEARWSHSQP